MTISYKKSLISSRGALEFAKRFFVGGRDLSPVSVRSLLQCRTSLTLLGLRVKYKMDFRVLARLSGCGYRALGKLWHKRSKRLERLYTAFSKPTGGDLLPLEFWIGRGIPLDPYLKGLIVDYIRKKVVPVELKLPPENLFPDESHIELLERTLYRNWMEQWLKWNKWYYTVALGPDPTLHDLFNAPIVETTWYRRNRDSDVFKFGLIWKTYDLVDKYGLHPKVGILEEGRLENQEDYGGIPAVQGSLGLSPVVRD